MTTLQAEVVAVDRVHVVIICPFCGRFHQHGSNGHIDDLSYGTRVSHCGDCVYELVTTGCTVRKETLCKRDLAVWKEHRRAHDHIY